MQRNLFEQRGHLFGVSLNIGIDRGVNRTRRDIVDGDVIGSEFQRDGAHQHTYTALRAAVRRVFGHGEVFMHRRNVDDAALNFALNHLASGSLRAEKDAFKVNAQHAVELLLGHLHEGIVNLHTSVVDHDVQAVEVFNGLLDKTLRLLHLGDIGLDDNHFAVILFNGLLYFLSLLLVVYVVDNHRCPFFGELNGDAAPDTAVRAGDNGNFVIEKTHDLYVLS